MAQMTLITGPQRRRRWSFEERRQILAAPDAAAIVVELAGGARVTIGAAAPVTLVTATLRALRR